MKTSKYNYITEFEALGLIMADAEAVYILKESEAIRVTDLSGLGIAINNKEKFYTLKINVNEASKI